MKELKRGIHNMQELKRKLSSRKFWMALAGFICSAGALFGISEHVASQISATVSAGGIVIAYILGESYIDAKK